MKEMINGGIVFVLIVLPIMKLVSEKTAGNPWWSSFTAELFAALISLAIASFLIPRYLDWRKKPVLEVINKKTSEKKCILNIHEDGTNYNGVFNLGVLNKKEFSYRDVYWHIYIPKFLNPRIRSGDYNREEISDGKCVKFSGQIKEPLYPHRRTTFLKEIELTYQTTDFWEDNDNGIYCSFSTEYGVYPEGSKKKNVLLEEPNFIKIVVLKGE